MNSRRRCETRVQCSVRDQKRTPVEFLLLGAKRTFRQDDAVRKCREWTSIYDATVSGHAQMHCIPSGSSGASARLLGGRGYRQDARHFPAAGRLDQDQVHQESGWLCGLSGRSDRKHDRDVQLRGAISEHRCLQAGSLGVEAPGSLIKRGKAFQGGVRSPHRRPPRDPEKIRGISATVTPPP